MTRNLNKTILDYDCYRCRSSVDTLDDVGMKVETSFSQYPVCNECAKYSIEEDKAFRKVDRILNRLDYEIEREKHFSRGYQKQNEYVNVSVTFSCKLKDKNDDGEKENVYKTTVNFWTRMHEFNISKKKSIETSDAPEPEEITGLISETLRQSEENIENIKKAMEDIYEVSSGW